MKRFSLILAALFFLSCGVSSSHIQATVSAGIQMTQTAALSAQLPTQTKPPAMTAKPAVTPTSPPPPLDLGSAKRILLQTGHCTPAGSKDCQWEADAAYICDQNGENSKKIVETGEVIGVSADGRQALLAVANSGLPTFTLSLIDLASLNPVQLAENYRHAFGCDGNHCAAIWLADGKIAYIGESKGQNNQPAVNIFVVNTDGSGARPLLALAPTQTPLYLYRTNDKERIYWESGNGAVPGGLNSMRMDGSDVRQNAGIIDPSFSPAGNRVAFLKTVNDLGYQTAFFVSTTNWESMSQIYNTQTGEYVGQYSWSPDGERLVLSVSTCAPTCTSKHYYWKTSATALQDLPAAIGFVATTPVWSADGRYVLYAGRDQTGGKASFSALNTETFTVQPFLEKIVLPEEDLEVEYFYVIP
jgi:hypothetical protein